LDTILGIFLLFCQQYVTLVFGTFVGLDRNFPKREFSHDFFFNTFIRDAESGLRDGLHYTFAPPALACLHP
jgi:hypothetical protein